MKVWKLWSEADDYENVIDVNALSIDEIQSFDGRSRHSHYINQLKIFIAGLEVEKIKRRKPNIIQ